jgi:capsid protein
MPTPISSNVPGPNFKDVIAICQRRVSRAMGVPYSQFSGDSAGENFSSMRGNELAARAGYQPLQVFAWDHLTGPWWQRVVNWAVLSGKLTLTAEQAAAIAADPEALHAGRPIFKGYAYVNPAQESMANATDIEANVKSEIEVIGERGGRWRQVIEERARFAAEFRRAWKAHGLEGEPPLAAFSAAAPAPATLRQKAEPEKPAPPDGDKSESDDSPAREEKPASGFARGGIVNVPTSLHRLREMASGLTLEQIDGVNRHSNGVNGHA